MEHHKSGRVRILAVMGAARSPFLPDVPTLKEVGVEFSAESWFAFYALAATSSRTLERLESAILAAAASPMVRKRIQALGFEPTTTPSQELKRVQRAEFEAWAKGGRDHRLQA